jgi:hypothetical protein
MNESKTSIGRVHNLRKVALATTIAITLGIFATVGVVAFRLLRHDVRCDESSEIPVWSPDGKWAVTSSTKACFAGPLSVTRAFSN